MSEIHRKEDINIWNKLLRPLRKGDKFKVIEEFVRFNKILKGQVGIIESTPERLMHATPPGKYFGMAIYWKRTHVHDWCYFSRDEIEVISKHAKKRKDAKEDVSETS